MKIVYFGSDVFLPCFEYFLQKHQILDLYTYHNNEDYFSDYAITRAAAEKGIPIHYEAITSEEITKLFTQKGCELLFSAEYNRKIPIPKGLPDFRGINVHCSFLPQGRSYYPIEGAMERELSCTGVTLHRLDSEIDRGDILDQRKIEISADTDSIDIYLHCAFHAKEMTEKLVDHIEDYWFAAQPQYEKFDYWNRPDDSLLTLHHEMNSVEAIEMFRKYNSMVQLCINGTWYYAEDLSAGRAIIPKDLWEISPYQILFRIRDGHLRLHIRPKV